MDSSLMKSLLGHQDSQHTKNIYLKWRHCELISALASFSGFLFATADYEIHYSPHRTHSECRMNKHGEWLRLLIALSSLISIIFMLLRNYNKSRWIASLSSPGMLESVLSTAYTKNTVQVFRFKRALEILSMCIFPYPFMNYYFYYPQTYKFEEYEICYYWSELLFVCMLFRFIFIFRTIANYSRYTNYLGRYICGKYEVKPNIRFAIKCLLQQAPLFILFIIVAFPAFLLFGIALRVFERPFEDETHMDYSYYLNAVWCVFITIVTVGYGDIVPATTFGRLIVFVCAFFGGVFVSMGIISLESNTSLNYNQHGAFITILKASPALCCIQRAFEYGMNKKRFGVYSEKTLQKYDYLRLAIEKFKAQRKVADNLVSTSTSEFHELKSSVIRMNQNIARLAKNIKSLKEKAM